MLLDDRIQPERSIAKSRQEGLSDQVDTGAVSCRCRIPCPDRLQVVHDFMAVAMLLDSWFPGMTYVGTGMRESDKKARNIAMAEMVTGYGGIAV